MNSNPPTETLQGEDAAQTPDVIQNIPLTQLYPFDKHVFKPYRGERLEKLAKSLRENGLIHPILVRPFVGSANDGLSFEIISGHNRFEAARLAGHTEIPVVIKKLSDDEAIILANEANIESRNFSTWLPSEKIKSINQYHAAAKRQGKAIVPKAASGDKHQKSDDGYARHRTAQIYGLSPSQVRMFIELSRLIEPLLDRLDAKDYGTTPASELSFISQNGQKIINSVLAEDNERKLYKITVKRSEELRKYFEDNVDVAQLACDKEKIKVRVREILCNAGDTSEITKPDLVRIPLSQEVYDDLFPDTPAPEDIAPYMIKCARYCLDHNAVPRDGVV
jgi:ParB family chromosome partitioning protein